MYARQPGPFNWCCSCLSYVPHRANRGAGTFTPQPHKNLDVIRHMFQAQRRHGKNRVRVNRNLNTTSRYIQHHRRRINEPRSFSNHLPPAFRKFAQLKSTLAVDGRLDSQFRNPHHRISEPRVRVIGLQPPLRHRQLPAHDDNPAPWRRRWVRSERHDIRALLDLEPPLEPARRPRIRAAHSDRALPKRRPVVLVKGNEQTESTADASRVAVVVPPADRQPKRVSSRKGERLHLAIRRFQYKLQGREFVLECKLQASRLATIDSECCAASQDAVILNRGGVHLIPTFGNDGQLDRDQSSVIGLNADPLNQMRTENVCV